MPDFLRRGYTKSGTKIEVPKAAVNHFARVEGWVGKVASNWIERVISNQQSSYLVRRLRDLGKGSGNTNAAGGPTTTSAISAVTQMSLNCATTPYAAKAHDPSRTNPDDDALGAPGMVVCRILRVRIWYCANLLPMHSYDGPSNAQNMFDVRSYLLHWSLMYAIIGLDSNQYQSLERSKTVVRSRLVRVYNWMCCHSAWLSPMSCAKLPYPQSMSGFVKTKYTIGRGATVGRGGTVYGTPRELSARRPPGNRQLGVRVRCAGDTGLFLLKFTRRRVQRGNLIRASPDICDIRGEARPKAQVPTEKAAVFPTPVSGPAAPEFVVALPRGTNPHHRRENGKPPRLQRPVSLRGANSVP
ncbi:hypothetical protein C8R47DRAFT_1064197 [Mycena vitilis]|nr:hypothetical protein C8R47DRAFT_1064197 [Mycena vitilis]